MVGNKKVSIIVPIYKVEKYIHRCVDSIINQTYPNLEIILVDDGSPDKCGEIAEQYKLQDNRVKVIHKENGGLSDARNYGMKEVTGYYTMFVDSDDWVAEKIIEMMVHHMVEHEADIVQSAFYYAYEDKLLLDNRYYNETNPPVILDNESLMYELVVNERVKNFAWGKLYKTELIRDIPFKKDVLFEDVYWAHHVMHQVNTYVIIHQPLYFYLQRDDSIVAAYTTRNLDIIRGLEERHQFIEKNYKWLIDESYQGILNNSLIHYYLLLKNRKKDKKGQFRKGIQLYIQDNYHHLREAVKNNRELKTQLILFRLSPFINILFLAIRKIISKLKAYFISSSFKQVKL